MNTTIEIYQLSESLVPDAETTYFNEEISKSHSELRYKYIKIVRAVKEWAEANDITEVEYSYSEGYGCQFESGYGFMRICFANIDLPFMTNGHTYKIIKESGDGQE